MVWTRKREGKGKVAVTFENIKQSIFLSDVNPV